METGACVRSSNPRSSISSSFRRCSIAHRGIRDPLIISKSLRLFAAHAVEALYAGPTKIARDQTYNRAMEAMFARFPDDFGLQSSLAATL